MSKRLITLVLVVFALAAAAVVLSACGSKSGTATTGNVTVSGSSS